MSDWQLTDLHVVQLVAAGGTSLKMTWGSLASAGVCLGRPQAL